MWLQHEAKVNVTRISIELDEVSAMFRLLFVVHGSGGYGRSHLALKASQETWVVILSYSNQLHHAIDLVSLPSCSGTEWMCREQRGLCVKAPSPHPSTSFHPQWQVTQSSKSQAPLFSSEQVARPAVAMVTSNNQSQARADVKRGQGVPIRRTTQSHPTSTRLHVGNLFLCATFLQREIEI